MKITKIRIKNYRSIQDSGDIYLEEKITVLAGKNESGKTAILHAFADFDPQRKIRPDAISIEDPSLIPEILVTLVVSKDRINEMLDSMGIKASVENDFGIDVRKVFPDQYSLIITTGTEILPGIFQKQKEDLIILARKCISEIKDVVGQSSDFMEEMLDLPLTETDEIISGKIVDFISQVNKTSETTPESQPNQLSKLLGELENIDSEFQKNKNLLSEFSDLLIKHLPTLIYFDSFDNLLPYTISIHEVDKNKPVIDFLQMAGIELSFLTDSTKDFQQKKNYLAGRSTVITGDFLDYWEQDKVELAASLNGENVVLGFKEQEKSLEFRMDQRSKGFQWFLSFYIQLKLHHGTQDKILLIDEPGLYLHPKAQKDVLKVLEDLSQTMPVIFSTHSPYLLEYDNLPRVKLVFKDKKKGTIVECKYHKISDQETLTPILTAIGLELTSGITNPDKLNNVLVEGASDYYYLTAFKKVLQIEDLNFIYGGGSGKMPNVGTILQGWGCKVIYLFDNDQGKKDGAKNLVDNWQVEKEKIKAIAKEKRVSAIEDLFQKDDFKKFVVGDKSVKYENKNSEYISDKDKVLKAKSFHSRIEEIKDNISEPTKNKFRELMEDLLEGFK